MFGPAPQGTPEGFWEGEGQNAHQIQVACWHHLHFKKARQVTVSVIRVPRSGAADTQRDPRVSWVLCVGQAMPALCEIPTPYARRYSLEHGYRFDKQDLLWEKAHLRSPEPLQHGTDLVACVHVPLVLARDLAAERRPWERTVRAVTPQQGRGAMGTILGKLGTPARVCQVRGKSPGRSYGALVEKAPRYKVVFKATEKTMKVATKV